MFYHHTHLVCLFTKHKRFWVKYSFKQIVILQCNQLLTDLSFNYYFFCFNRKVTSVLRKCGAAGGGSR